MAALTVFTGERSAVARCTAPCGSSATMRMASMRRYSGRWERSAAGASSGCASACSSTASSAAAGAPASPDAPVSVSVADSGMVIVCPQRDEVLVAEVVAGPADRELAERLELLERDRRVPVELEHCEEAGDDDAARGLAGDQLAEGRRALRAQGR